MYGTTDGSKRLDMQFYKFSTDENVDYYEFDTTNNEWSEDIRLNVILNDVSDQYLNVAYLQFALSERDGDQNNAQIILYQIETSPTYNDGTKQLIWNNISLDLVSTDVELDYNKDYNLYTILTFDFNTNTYNNSITAFYDDIGTSTNDIEVSINSRLKFPLRPMVCIPTCGQFNYNALIDSNYYIRYLFDSSYPGYYNYSYDTQSWKICLLIPDSTIHDFTISPTPLPIIPDAYDFSLSIDEMEGLIWQDKAKISLRYSSLADVGTRVKESVIEVIRLEDTPGETVTRKYFQIMNDSSAIQYNIYADTKSALDIVCKVMNNEIQLFLSTNGSM